LWSTIYIGDKKKGGKMNDSIEPNGKRLWLTSVLKTPGRLWILLLIALWAMANNNQTVIEDIISILIV
jgi:hypothetical protein